MMVDGTFLEARAGPRFNTVPAARAEHAATDCRHDIRAMGNMLQVLARMKLGTGLAVGCKLRSEWLC